MQSSIRLRHLLNYLAACLLVCCAAGTAMAGWTTSGNKIVAPSGVEFRITGINWYGFETADNVAHGLYAHDYTYIVDSIRQYGYSTIRIPFSNAMWELDPVPNSNTISACPTCKGKHARDILALIVNYAGSKGLHVILDN
jgi:endoglucanase